MTRCMRYQMKVGITLSINTNIYYNLAYINYIKHKNCSGGSGGGGGGGGSSSSSNSNNSSSIQRF